MTYESDQQLDLSQYSSLIMLIEQACKQYANKSAYTCLGHHTSFKEIERDSRYFATYLQSIDNLKPGDRIAIQLPNITQFVIAAYGAIRAGMVLVNTNPLYTERELIHQFNDSGAKVLVVLADRLPTLTKVIADTHIETVISTHVLDLVTPNILEQPKVSFMTHTFCHVLSQGAAREYHPIIGQLEQLAALQYTGGTTGLSKGAMLSHGNLIANAMQIKARLGDKLLKSEEVFVAPLPIYHIYAFMVNLVLYFEQGSCSVLIPNPRDTSALIQAMSAQKFTGFAGLNTLFVGLCHQVEFQALDFSYLKVTLSGGTALTHAAANVWQQTTGCTISEGYGLSETSPVVSLNSPGQEQIGTIGKPLIGTEIKIIDANDKEVPLGDSGELSVRGPQVMQGYWNNPEATGKVMTQDGFFKTGDIAVATKDGFHKIVDRIKDMIIVSGFNVYPNEIEDVLSNHHAILECAVIGLQDERTGEKVKVVVVLNDPKSDHDALRVEIEAYCRQQLTSYKVPRVIEFVDALPKSTVGKILRRELRDATP
ncbi:AMP-binding protein [Shewanella sp. VB17]|uniref:AMP-binding protein n=1 Tax=Shewanella sp. VB17 TaxID=2739432 RepID=UPI001563723D|nr:AMP-binding protein [Shewanella sp. VB17]NRD73210.1 AMP-binding protein [Shewanella sp. VB17]